MELRYATNPEQIVGMGTEDLRAHYLVENLFVADEVRTVYTHHDRIILAGIKPASRVLHLEAPPEIRSDYFLERREAGIVNVGGGGSVEVDGVPYEMVTGACLYVSRGSRAVAFKSSDGEQDRARFYLFSAPAWADYPTTLAEPGQGIVRELGDQETSNRRTLHQYIHEQGIASCQVMMGVTNLHPGSMWNTQPAHTHDRRTECYLYFNIPDTARVIHIMGRARETRHLVMKNEEAVVSPSWSIHTGVGTAAYSFVWAMAGENKLFDDMDPVPATELR